MRKFYSREDIIDEMKKQLVITSTHIDTLNELLSMLEKNSIELDENSIMKLAEGECIEA